MRNKFIPHVAEAQVEDIWHDRDGPAFVFHPNANGAGAMVNPAFRGTHAAGVAVQRKIPGSMAPRDRWRDR